MNAGRVKRTALRKQIRQLRAQIPAPYRQQASYRISEQVAALDVYRRAERVAGYLPFEGEADPLPLMDRAIQDSKQVFVPQIVKKGAPLQFARWSRETAMRKNFFGIDEPDVPAEEWIGGPELDLVLVPLVGFDEARNRIGVGGGYYDRTFSFLREKGLDDSSRPRLIGVAFELQKLSAIETKPWDVPLDAVVTELTIYGQQG